MGAWGRQLAIEVEGQSAVAGSATVRPRCHRVLLNPSARRPLRRAGGYVPRRTRGKKMDGSSVSMVIVWV